MAAIIKYNDLQIKQAAPHLTPWHVQEVRNSNSKRDLTKLYTICLAFHLFLRNESLAFSLFRCFRNLHNTD